MIYYRHNIGIVNIKNTRFFYHIVYITESELYKTYSFTEKRIIMLKKLTNQELYAMNIIAIKVEDQTRDYTPTLGNIMIEKNIKRTQYLKLCWMCGKPYESYRRSSFACQRRCSQNISRYRKSGLNPPANMVELCKPKNVKDIKYEFGYR